MLLPLKLHFLMLRFLIACMAAAVACTTPYCAVAHPQKCTLCTPTTPASDLFTFQHSRSGDLMFVHAVLVNVPHTTTVQLKVPHKTTVQGPCWQSRSNCTAPPCCCCTTNQQHLKQLNCWRVQTTRNLRQQQPPCSTTKS
jgi:hypothetical protein